MAQELAYTILTPYSLDKSRTGGILARLNSRTDLDLVAIRMFAPSSELIAEYADTIVSDDDPQEKEIQELIRDYVLQQLAPDAKTGTRRRVMMLLFKGEDAARKVRSIVGNIRHNRRGGETIRDTYGDLIEDDAGSVRYMEPAVLAAPNATEAAQKLKLWSKYSEADGGLLENVVTYPDGESPQRALVLIKPDNFRFPTGRPGNVIDFFSRTGLYMVAAKLQQMSVAEALEFYGPVKEILQTKLNDAVGEQTREILEKALGFPIPTEAAAGLGAVMGPISGEHQFESIIEFMSGRAPSKCPQSTWDEPGSERCIALVYEGPDAIKKIRTVLGPTNPAKAPPGSIRREFGSNIMVNAAHASDSPENAEREIAIVRIGKENVFGKVIEDFFSAEA